MKRVARWFALIFSLIPLCAWGATEVISVPAPWGPIGTTVTLSVSNSSSSVLLGWVGVQGVPPSGPPTAKVCNTGAVAAFALMVANSSAAVTTSTGTLVAPGICVPLAVSGNTYLAGITASSTTSLSIQAGSGTIVAGTAGSGGGGSCAALAGDVSGTCGANTVDKVSGTSPGTGVVTAFGINVGTAGSFLVNGGALGTPSSGVATNLTGTAASLTAGTVTTNANLTGPITSSGNATAIASQTGTGSTFVVQTSPTLTTPVLGVATGTTLALGGAIVNSGNVLSVTGSSTIAYNASAGGAAAATAFIGNSSNIAEVTFILNGGGNSSGNGINSFTINNLGSKMAWQANSVNFLDYGIAESSILTSAAALSMKGTTLPTQGAGVLGLAGTASNPTLGANSEGDIWLTTAGGLNLIGQGSTDDFRLYNKSGSIACNVATGATTLACGTFSGAGTSLTGTASSLTAGTATNAVNVGITDDNATNATMYPLWVTAATGNLPSKVSSTGIVWNPSSKQLTLGTTSAGSQTIPALLALYPADDATNSAIALRQNNNIAFGSDFAIDQTSGDTIWNGVNNNSAAAAVRITRVGGVLLPSLASSSAATTGTLCWTTGGNVNVDTTVACLASDERLKDISGPLTGALAEVMALQPMTYGWKTGTPKAKDDPGEHIGLGAFATAYADERLIARGADGQPRAWRQDAMIALLVAAVKEQQAEIKDIRAQLGRR